MTAAGQRIEQRLRLPWHWPRNPFLRMALFVLVAVVAALNCLLITRLIEVLVSQTVPPDWVQFREAATRAFSDALYTVSDSYQFRWSPVAAILLIPLTALGPAVWQLSQVVVAATLPTVPLRLAVLTTVPFWSDLQAGNTITFVFAAAAWALTGSGAATGIFLALSLLIPRPIMLPVAIWLLWHRPNWRIPFVVVSVTYTGVLAAIGELQPWLTVLLSAAPEEFSHPWQISPSAIIGATWIPIGLVLAGFLTWRGRLGLASLAITPYLFLYYAMFGWLELISARRERGVRLPAERPLTTTPSDVIRRA